MEMNPGSILWNPNYKPVQLCELALHSLLSLPTLSPTISHTFYNMLPHRTSLRQFFLEIWTPRVSRNISAPKTRGGFLSKLFLPIFLNFLCFLGSHRAFLLQRPAVASWTCFFFLFFLFSFAPSGLSELFCF